MITNEDTAENSRLRRGCLPVRYGVRTRARDQHPRVFLSCLDDLPDRGGYPGVRSSYCAASLSLRDRSGSAGVLLSVCRYSLDVFALADLFPLRTSKWSLLL